MSVGAFFDKVVMIAIGGYFIYLSKKKKEHLGEKKARWLRIGGIVLIVTQLLLAALEQLKN